jgi:hypothetical protein
VARIRVTISSWPASASSSVAYLIISMPVSPRSSGSSRWSFENTIVSKMIGGPGGRNRMSSPSQTVLIQYGPTSVLVTRL